MEKNKFLENTLTLLFLSVYPIHAAEMIHAEKMKAAPPKPTITQQVSKPSACAPRTEGRLKMFNATKGYGFIKDQKSGNEIFLHVTGLVDSNIKPGDAVCYNTIQGRKGLQAVDVILKK